MNCRRLVRVILGECKSLFPFFMVFFVIFADGPLISYSRCSSLDELIEPLIVHLVPKLSDDLVIGILGGVSKRLEAAIRKVSVRLSEYHPLFYCSPAKL